MVLQSVAKPNIACLIKNEEPETPLVKTGDKTDGILFFSMWVAEIKT